MCEMGNKLQLVTVVATRSQALYARCSSSVKSVSQSDAIEILGRKPNEIHYEFGLRAHKTLPINSPAAYSVFDGEAPQKA
jgi:hypothetical protein